MSDSKSESLPVETSMVNVSTGSSTDSVVGVVESPTVVLEETNVVKETASDVATTLATEVKEKVGNSESVEKVNETVTESVEKANESVTEAVEKVNETVTEAVVKINESVTEVATTLATEVKEKVENSEAVEKAKEKVGETGFKIMDTVSEVLKDKNLSGMVKLIVDDPVFIAKVESSVKNILKDGKVDQSDIPEFVFLIMEAYNTLPKARLSREELPEFVSCVFNYLVDKYNLIPKNERTKYEVLVASSVKLVLMTPQLRSFSIWKCPCW